MSTLFLKGCRWIATEGRVWGRPMLDWMDGAKMP